MSKRFSLAKASVVRGKRQFSELFSMGKRIKSGSLLLIYLPSSDTRVGFIASKKIGGAVMRNRVKRLLREAYRMRKEIFEGWKVLFYALGAVDKTCILQAFERFKTQASS
ncbi:MAG TPA: ribonuclease P protein component [bacterium]